VAQGRHEELLAAPGHYREAALAQMFAGQSTAERDVDE
jgi:hypothetical protein